MHVESTGKRKHLESFCLLLCELITGALIEKEFCGGGGDRKASKGSPRC